MVEFGLKLEDNKVAEWSEYYINYDKLKAFLKKAKSAQKKYDEQAMKRPEDAKKVLEAYKAGIETAVLTTPYNSTGSLIDTLKKSLSGTNLMEMGEDVNDQLQPDQEGEATERTSLLSKDPNKEQGLVIPPKKRSSHDKKPPLSPPRSPKSDHKKDVITALPSPPGHTSSPTKKVPSFHNKISELSDRMFYGGSRYEKTLRGYLQEIDNVDKEFGTMLVDEQTKSVEFYFKKLKELEVRLQGLMESVAQSTVLKKAAADALKKIGGNGDVEGGGAAAGGIKIMDSTKNVRGGSGGSKLGDISEEEPMVVSRASSDPEAISKRQSEHQTISLPLTPPRSSTTKRQSNANRLSSSMTQSKKHIKRATQIRFEALLQKFQDVTTENPEQIMDDSDMNVDDNDLSDDEAEKEEAAVAEASSIKRALIDQYRQAKLLHNFAIMNYTGFVKIIKKHDKTIPSHKGEFKNILEPHNLYHEGEAVDQLSKQYERYFARWFCNGDVRAAHAQMLPKKGDGLDMDWSQLRLGYRMGMCAILALWVCWDCIWGMLSHGNSTIGGRAAFPVFRACGGILLLQWFWACSVFIWTRYRINYIYLFDFNPRIVATPLGLCEDAVDNTLVFLILMLLYYKAGAKDIPEIIPDGGYPFILVLYTAYNLIFPFRTRLPMWRAIGKVVSAPLHSPNFFHGYVGDIFTSFVKVFQDIAWTIMWVATGSFTASDRLDQNISFSWSSEPWYKEVLIPLICLFPLVVRFNQCLRRYIDTGDRFPHLANATKYAMSQTVTLFGAFHPLYLEHSSKPAGGINMFQIFWTLIFVSSSLYSFFWDVKMDWGLGDKKYGFLNESLMYPRRYYYYTIIALDLVLRFMWVQTLVPPSSGANFEVPIYLATMSMMLELFRRTIWGFLRLENEHRSNAAGFRRVGFVPLHFNTGHKHKYKEKKEMSGSSVLQEVIFIALSVVAVCVSSVIAAQRANKGGSQAEDKEL